MVFFLDTFVSNCTAADGSYHTSGLVHFLAQLPVQNERVHPVIHLFFTLMGGKGVSAFTKL